MNLNFTSSKDLANMPIATHVILASQSIGRRQLLEKLGIPFRVVVSHVNEDAILGKDPLTTIKKRAASKLEEILNKPRVYSLDERVNNLIITADSMAILGKKVFGKAETRLQAKDLLKELMGKTHTFATAIAVAYLKQGSKEPKKWEKTEITKVTMRKLTNPEIDLYVNRYDFTRFAAAYALQEAPWDLVTKIDGSYTNVIGLPFEALLPILRQLAIIKLPETQ